MKFITLTCLLCCGISWCSASHAGGFFRRVPEVGEWARYDMRFKRVEVREATDAESSVSREVSGNLELKCVGEDTVEDHRCLWLEACLDGTDQDGESGSMIIKLLTPVEQVVDADVADHFVRGWIQRTDEDVESLELDGQEFEEGDTWFAILLAFSSSGESVGNHREKTLTIDGVQVEVSHSESGVFATREFDDAQLSGTATWWPSFDHAFGVVSAELAWREVRNPSKRATEMLFWMDLVETGTDAESDLPENN